MKSSILLLAGGCAVFILLAAFAVATACPPDSVQVGPMCVDKYEESVWEIPATNPQGKSNAVLLRKVQEGTATLANLMAGGATQHGCTALPYNHAAFPASFPTTGNWTNPLYAVSVAGVKPTACVSWFQAEQACRLAGKRLLTNQEWQAAAAGTPDPDSADDGTTTCATADPYNTRVQTGSRAACVSSWGAYDMVGNVAEWTADWVPQSTGCSTWGTFSNDTMCLAGAATAGLGPGVLVRGNDPGAGNGVFSIVATSTPSEDSGAIGFRCGR